MVADHPGQKLAFEKPLFSDPGVQYFGCFFVSVKRSTEKRWGWILRCLTTSVVHIDVVHCMDTSNCVMGRLCVASHQSFGPATILAYIPVTGVLSNQSANSFWEQSHLSHNTHITRYTLHVTQLRNVTSLYQRKLQLLTSSLQTWFLCIFTANAVDLMITAGSSNYTGGFIFPLVD